MPRVVSSSQPIKSTSFVARVHSRFSSRRHRSSFVVFPAELFRGKSSCPRLSILDSRKKTTHSTNFFAADSVLETSSLLELVYCGASRNTSFSSHLLTYRSFVLVVSCSKICSTIAFRDSCGYVAHVRRESSSAAK